MKSLLVAVALGLGSLALIGATPSQAKASWLSEALHARFDPYYYGDYPPYVYPDTVYYSPAYVYPYYGYYAPYYSPGVSFYVWPRYGWGRWGGWHGYWGGYRGGWHGYHGGWHGYHGGWHGHHR